MSSESEGKPRPLFGLAWPACPPSWLLQETNRAWQSGTHYIPSLDVIAGDSLELRESNPAEWRQMATAVSGCNAQKYHTGTPQCIHRERSKSLFGSWILNQRDSLVREVSHILKGGDCPGGLLTSPDPQVLASSVCSLG